MILQYPMNGISSEAAETLRQVSTPYETGEIPSAELVNSMRQYQSKCLGLSAVQLGVPLRLIMVKYGEDFIFLSNPEIVRVSQQTYPYPEGCLSINNGHTMVTFHRHKRVKVRYIDLEGRQRTVKAEGLTARTLQHEVDHLEGKLIIDYK